jgi:hypothetical protein
MDLRDSVDSLPADEPAAVRKRALPLVAIVATSIILFLSGVFFAPPPSQAMPQFAEATGLQCSACHTMVPLLNAYGRYVQRTAYTAVDRDVLAKTFPVWIGESINYDSTAGAGTGTPRTGNGNLAVHAFGYAAPNVTYHVQQWIVQGEGRRGATFTRGIWRGRLDSKPFRARAALCWPMSPDDKKARGVRVCGASLVPSRAV